MCLPNSGKSLLGGFFFAMVANVFETRASAWRNTIWEGVSPLARSEDGYRQGSRGMVQAFGFRSVIIKNVVA